MLGCSEDCSRFCQLAHRLENKIDYVEGSRATSRFRLEITERFANYLGILRHDVNQLMKARNKIGTKVDLRVKRVADRLERVAAHMATLSKNA